MGKQFGESSQSKLDFKSFQQKISQPAIQTSLQSQSPKTLYQLSSFSNMPA